MKMDCICKFLCLVVIILVTLSFTSGKMCSYKKAKPVVTNMLMYKPCKKTYRDSCSWFSLSYCTFYRMEHCKTESKDIEYTYHTVMDCCKGYVMAPNKSCVEESLVETEPWYLKIQNTTEASVYLDPKDIVTLPPKVKPDVGGQEKDKDKIPLVESKKGGLSHGAYAGIACALLFLGIVAILTVIAVRKKKRRRQAKRNDTDNDMASQQLAAEPEQL